MSNQQGTNNIIQNLNQGSNQYYPISQPLEGQVPRQQQFHSLNGKTNVNRETMNVSYSQNITALNNNNYPQIKTLVPTTQNQPPINFYQQQPPPPPLPLQQLLYSSAMSPTLPQNTFNPQSTCQQPYYSPHGVPQIVYENPINFQSQQPTKGQSYYVTNVAQAYEKKYIQPPPSLCNSHNTNVYSLPVYQVGTLTNANPPKHIYIKGKLYRLTSSKVSSADGRTISNITNQEYLPQLSGLTSPMIKPNNSSRANSGNRSMTRVNSMFLPKIEQGTYASRAASLALTESSTTFNSIVDARNIIELSPIGQIKEDYPIKLPQLFFKGQPESNNIINNDNNNNIINNNSHINNNNNITTSNATVECGQVESKQVNPTATSSAKKFVKTKETGKNISSDIDKKKNEKTKKNEKKKYVRPLKFECEICQKKFHRQDALQTHMNMHLNINPYECSVCGKCFNAKQNMVRHERNHGTGGRVDKKKKTKVAH